jgi:hypothetical protein
MNQLHDGLSGLGLLWLLVLLFSTPAWQRPVVKDGSGMKDAYM